MSDDPDNIIVPKRAAKSTAMELTGKPCKCKEQGGRKFILVDFGPRVETFGARTWFLALAVLKDWLDKRANPEPTE